MSGIQSDTKWTTVSRLTYTPHPHEAHIDVAKLKKTQLIEQSAVFRSHSPTFQARSCSQIAFNYVSPPRGLNERRVAPERNQALKRDETRDDHEPSNSTVRTDYRSYSPTEREAAKQPSKRPHPQLLEKCAMVATSDTKRNYVAHHVGPVKRVRPAEKLLEPRIFDGTTTHHVSYGVPKKL